MKFIRFLLPAVTALLFGAPILRGQDFSKYRDFSLGTNLTTVLKRTEKKLADVNTTHGAPALFQEVTWWPPSPPGAYSRPDSVEQVLFYFLNGELYKIAVSYDQSSTEGLTAEDLIKTISAKYGPPASVVPETASRRNVGYDMQQKTVASWQDSQYCLNLVRPASSDRFGLLIYSKRVNTEAELGLLEAVKFEKEQAPAREAERQKKETDALELTRQQNQKSFRP
jgi:hypothetical protein